MPPADLPHRDDIARGVIFGCLAMFLFAAMQACAKLLAPNHHGIEVAFYRNLIGIVPMLFYIIAAKRFDLLKTTKPVALVFRVLIGSIGLIGAFTAVGLLPLADATLIFLTSVLIVPVLSFFFLNEKMGFRRWSAILIGLAGVLLMIRPTGEIETIGFLIAFATAWAQAAVHVFVRHLKTEPSFTVTFYFILGGIVIPGLFMPFIANMPTAGDMLILLGVGVSGLLGQYCFTSSLKRAPASVIAPLNYTGLLWATMFDIALWNYVPGASVYAGAAIIIFSQGYIIHRERLAKKQALKMHFY